MNSFIQLNFQPVEIDMFDTLKKIKEKLKEKENFLLLQPDELCILLQRRTTQGSVDIPLNIDYEKLIEASNVKLKSDGERTVLNKAFWKHHHRN